MKSTLLCVGALALASPLHAQNLIKNGDFEADSPAVPSGWSMWGQAQWKNAANYTRDTQNAHSGAASLRIFRPANTGGYVAAEPNTNSVETQRDMVYTISFWAKTDAPGAAQMTIFGLQSLQPFVGDVLFGSKIDVTGEWKKWEFGLAEGFNFDAAKIHRLQLAFGALANNTPDVQRTLWIDDVEIMARPVSVQARSLLDINSISYTPVQHRLQPGNELNITVDANQKLRRATREAEGASFHRLQGYMSLPYDAQGQYKLSPTQETAIRELKPSHTRIYGLGDEPKFTLNQSIDNAAHVLERTGIGQSGTVLEFEDQHAQRKLSPQQWAEGVKYSQSKGYKFRYWEISNEPYIPYKGSRELFKTSEDYISHVKQVAPAIRAAQPKAQIGVEIFGITGRPLENLQWSNAVMKATAGNYDFAVAHWYSLIDVSKNSFETVVASENYRVLDQIARTNALLKAYNPDRDVYQYDTEWSLYAFNSGDPIETIQNGNIMGALHRAIRLIYYVREDLVRGASAWEMFAGRDRWNSLAFLPPEGDKKSMIYWTHRLFNENTGQWALQMTGTAPYYTPPADAGTATQRPLPGPLTPAIAMLSSDAKKLTFIVANASWDKAVPMSLQLKNFKAGSVTGQKLSNDDLNHIGLLDNKAEFVNDFPVAMNGSKLSCTLPPHSVVFLTFQQ